MALKFELIDDIFVPEFSEWWSKYGDSIHSGVGDNPQIAVAKKAVEKRLARMETKSRRMIGSRIKKSYPLIYQSQLLKVP